MKENILKISLIGCVLTIIVISCNSSDKGVEKNIKQTDTNEIITAKDSIQRPLVDSMNANTQE